MKSYRCIVRSSEDQVAPHKTLIVMAPDCRAAAKTALDELVVQDTDWVEVWDGEERVLLRRKSNLYPRRPVASPSQGESRGHATYCRAPR